MAASVGDRLVCVASDPVKQDRWTLYGSCQRPPADRRRVNMRPEWKSYSLVNEPGCLLYYMPWEVAVMALAGNKCVNGQVGEYVRSVFRTVLRSVMAN